MQKAATRGPMTLRLARAKTAQETLNIAIVIKNAIFLGSSFTTPEG